MSKQFIVGLDLGKENDYTALSVVEKSEIVVSEEVTTYYEDVETSQSQYVPGLGSVPVAKQRMNQYVDRKTENEYAVRHLERFELGTPYRVIAEKTAELMQTPEIRGRATCVVDKTGVGVAVVEMIEAAGVKPVCITITGGDSVTGSRRDLRVPKAELAGTMQVLLQNGQLKISSYLELGRILKREMQNFRRKVNKQTGHTSYEHYREGQHDDLVLSVALATWYAESGKTEPDSWIVVGIA